MGARAVLRVLVACLVCVLYWIGVKRFSSLESMHQQRCCLSLWNVCRLLFFFIDEEQY